MIAICQLWEESDSWSGRGSFGYSLHATAKDHKKYLSVFAKKRKKEYQANNCQTPDWYDYPSFTPPFIVEASEEDVRTCRHYGKPPMPLTTTLGKGQ